MPSCQRCQVSDAPLADTYRQYALGGMFCSCCQIIMFNRRYGFSEPLAKETDDLLVKMQRRAHAQARRVRLPPAPNTSCGHGEPIDRE